MPVHSTNREEKKIKLRKFTLLKKFHFVNRVEGDIEVESRKNFRHFERHERMKKQNEKNEIRG